MEKSYKDVLDLWFDEDHVGLHFDSNEEVDEKIRKEFLETWEKAKEGLLVDCREISMAGLQRS